MRRMTMNALPAALTNFMKKDVIHYGILVMIAGCSFLWFWPLRGLIGHYYVTPDWNVDWCLAQWRTQFSPLFINVGTFLALLCLPLINKKMAMLKLIALIFAVENFLFAVIWEYRVWFEIIPVTLLGFELYASHPCKEKSQKICVL